ncbi:8898_t:CDS:2, partial [Funneliformis geosporum]
YGLKKKYWKIITTTAAQIWKNKGGDKKTCDRLLAQIRNYELKVDPYDQEFDKQIETPMTMAKIRSFYISNIKNKLAYVGQQHLEDELHKMIEDSTFLQFEKEEEEEE